MTEIEKMCRAHFNEPILTFFEIGRLIGFAEDDHDFYLIIRYPHRPEPKTVYHTAVGGYTFLNCLKFQEFYVTKDGEVGDDLSRLDTMLALNGVPPEPVFIVKKFPPYPET